MGRRAAEIGKVEGGLKLQSHYFSVLRPFPSLFQLHWGLKNIEKTDHRSPSHLLVAVNVQDGERYGYGCWMKITWRKDRKFTVSRPNQCLLNLSSAAVDCPFFHFAVEQPRITHLHILYCQMKVTRRRAVGAQPPFHLHITILNDAIFFYFQQSFCTGLVWFFEPTEWEARGRAYLAPEETFQGRVIVFSDDDAVVCMFNV